MRRALAGAGRRRSRWPAPAAARSPTSRGRRSWAAARSRTRRCSSPGTTATRSCPASGSTTASSWRPGQRLRLRAKLDVERGRGRHGHGGRLLDRPPDAAARGRSPTPTRTSRATPPSVDVEDELKVIFPPGVAPSATRDGSASTGPGVWYPSLYLTSTDEAGEGRVPGRVRARGDRRAAARRLARADAREGHADARAARARRRRATASGAAARSRRDRARRAARRAWSAAGSPRAAADVGRRTWCGA